MDNNFKPFTNYVFEVDDEAEEIVVEAWDDETPMDTWRARISFEDFSSGVFLWRLNRALSRT